MVCKPTLVFIFRPLVELNNLSPMINEYHPETQPNKLVLQNPFSFHSLLSHHIVGTFVTIHLIVGVCLSFGLVVVCFSFGLVSPHLMEGEDSISGLVCTMCYFTFSLSVSVTCGPL